VFGPDGVFVRRLNIESDLRDAEGRQVYVGAVKSMVCDADAIYLVDAAGRVYRSPSPDGIVSGGRLYLGPGAAGRQFDLAQADAGKLAAEVQPARVKHRSQGRLLAYRGSRPGTGNCEREGVSALADGERTMWTPARIGEPFTVALFDADNSPIPTSNYAIEYEEKPGLFGSQYDFFRITNRSGRAWQGVTFVAESAG
jgi:hypothetical protein